MPPHPPIHSGQGHRPRRPRGPQVARAQGVRPQSTLHRIQRTGDRIQDTECPHCLRCLWISCCVPFLASLACPHALCRSKLSPYPNWHLGLHFTLSSLLCLTLWLLVVGCWCLAPGIAASPTLRKSHSLTVPRLPRHPYIPTPSYILSRSDC